MRTIKIKEASVMLNKYHKLEGASPSSIDLDLKNINLDNVFARIFRPSDTSELILNIFLPTLIFDFMRHIYSINSSRLMLCLANIYLFCS